MEQMLGPMPPGFERANNKSVYWTLSLYINQSVVKNVLGTLVTADQHREFQRTYLDSARLGYAIEPLFNDIADREHLGQVNDFLLSTPGVIQGELLEFNTLDVIRWTTEGKTFKCKPPGLGRQRRLRQRRFWYAHKNGAYSYHLSFRYQYDHNPGDLYFLSLLQKLAAPKEFTANPLPAGNLAWYADEPENGVYPLQSIRVRNAENSEAVPFWQFIAKQYENDALSLFEALSNACGITSFDRKEIRFRNTVTHSQFIEIPDLIMPVSRFMFFFQDTMLFDRLMPPIDPASGERPRRAVMVQSECYVPYIEKIEEKLAQCATSSCPEIELEDEYWDWVTNRPEYSSLTQQEVVEIKKSVPAFESGRPDCLHYLFLSGFNQNIIDFMNQDTSEILDSLDPIYPTNEIQDNESFFIRFANPRALITYVKSSRSLEAGNDYIGTCPYAFLIQVASIHNEFLAREYEYETFELVEKAKRYNKKRKLKLAAEAFYDFRTSAYAQYKANRYSNIFRYDTERDVFQAIEEMRGTLRKDVFLEELVGNMESQTRDLEARLAKADEQSISVLLGAVGILGFFQILFTWADTLREFSKHPGSPVMSIDATLPFIHFKSVENASAADSLSISALYLSLGFTGIMLIGLIYVFVKRLRR